MNGSKVSPLEEHQDVWIGDEFWGFCSGQSNTWEIILAAFIELGEDEQFIKKYRRFFSLNDKADK